MSAHPDVIAHRGARRLAVENTLEALSIAWAEGADGVEFDVQLSADGELFVFHDPDLFAHTGSRVPVQRWNWRDLRAVVLRDGSGRSASIPHLDAVLEALEDCQGQVHAELKAGEATHARALGERFARRTESLALEGWSVSSFSMQALAAYVRAGGVRPVAALFARDEGEMAQLAGPAPAGITAAMSALTGELGVRPSAVHPHHELVAPGVLEAWRAEGAAVRSWTVNEPAQWYQMTVWGLDGLITDDPGGLRRFLRAELG